MKIIYAIEDRVGAAIQLQQFVNNTLHEVKIAAYPSALIYINVIDWNLFATHKNNIMLLKLQHDIENYYPDLVIVDGDSIVANIASHLEIPIIYCSPLHLLDGIVWKKNQRSYVAHLEKIRQRLKKMPEGVCKFIYSPFGDLENAPELHDGFEWIQPYHNAMPNNNTRDIILAVIEDKLRYQNFQTIFQQTAHSVVFDKFSNMSYADNLIQTLYFFTEGHTKYISDAVYNNRFSIVTPNVNDVETLLNATWCNNLKIGIDIGQIDLIGRGAVPKIDKLLDDSGFLPNNTKQIISRHKKLNERINELWEYT